MKITVLGTGKVGGGLGRRWQDAGHDVAYPGRDHAAAAAAVRDADAVLLAVPTAAATELVASLAINLNGRILIDATNDVEGTTRDQAAAIATAAPGARVVKAFNTVFAAIYDDIDAHPGAADLAICGDDPEAKAAGAELARDAGFRPVDCGGLDAAPDLEGFARMVIRTAYSVGRGPFAYRFGSPGELASDIG